MDEDQTTTDTSDLPELWLHQGVPFWRDPVSRAVYQLQPDHWEGVFAGVPAEAVRLVPETANDEAKALGLIRCLIDTDPCWFDHNGGCKAHGYLSLEPGEICPVQEAKDLLDSKGVDWRDA